MISNSVIFCTAIMTIWCSFDVAGRYWVRLKKYKNSKNVRSKCQISGSEFSIQPSHMLAPSEIPPLLEHQPSSEVSVFINLAMQFRRCDKLCSNLLDLNCKLLFYSNRDIRITWRKGEIQRVVGSTGKLYKIW